MTDWYNAFIILSLFPELLDVDYKVIFLDGHPQGNLDGAWDTVFKQPTYVKQLAGKACFKKAYFVPPGYMGGVSLNGMDVKNPDHECRDHVHTFPNFFIQRYGLNW